MESRNRWNSSCSWPRTSGTASQAATSQHNSVTVPLSSRLLATLPSLRASFRRFGVGFSVWSPLCSLAMAQEYRVFPGFLGVPAALILTRHSLGTTGDEDLIRPRDGLRAGDVAARHGGHASAGPYVVGT